MTDCRYNDTPRSTTQHQWKAEYGMIRRIRRDELAQGDNTSYWGDFKNPLTRMAYWTMLHVRWGGSTGDNAADRLRRRKMWDSDTIPF